MGEQPENRTLECRQEAAAYVAELTADLARIARQHQLDALSYLLDMALLEAQQAAGGPVGREQNLN
jgi:hypothetical protein